MGCLPLPIGAAKHRSSTAAIEAGPRQTLGGRVEERLGAEADGRGRNRVVSGLEFRTSDTALPDELSWIAPPHPALFLKGGEGMECDTIVRFGF